MVTFSGDKLLGGPQAGIILGRREFVAGFKKNPLTRALRVDKLTLAALEATLRLYRDEAEAFARTPTLRMIATPLNVLQERAAELASLIRAADPHGHLKIEVQSGFSQVGGGSLPAQDLPTFTVAIQSSKFSTHQIEHHLRNAEVPIIGRIESNCYLLDVRTLNDDDLKTGGGSGLGLSICRSIAEAHGGRIWAAHSRLGGLAVHLELPASRGSGDAT